MTEPLSTQPAPSRNKLLIGSLAAVGVAAVALVVFVLPAEYGIDPTGLGKTLGVTKLSDPVESDEVRRGKLRTNVLFPLDSSATLDEAALTSTLTGAGLSVPAGTPLATDRYTVELLPFEGIEMKYELAQGAPMIFRWTATGLVNFDMHSHPHDGGPEMTESYAIADGQTQTGVYVAQFTGIHGWYWQNRTLEPVTVTVDATGAFTEAFTFDKAGQHPREISGLAGAVATPAAASTAAPAATPSSAAP